MRSVITAVSAVVVLPMLLLGTAVALDPAERCAVDKLKAFREHSECLSKSGQKAFKDELTMAEEQQQVQACRIELIESYEKAEARAVKKGGQCPTVGDAAEVHDAVVGACCPLCGCF